jgi:DNA-binding XRE family transcriptional regulator
MTQTQLAELCNVTQQTISKIERGEVVPLDGLKVLLAQALRTEPWVLFSWPGQIRSRVKAS